MSDITISIQHCAVGSSQCNKVGGKKRYTYWKGRSKSTLFTDDMI